MPSLSSVVITLQLLCHVDQIMITCSSAKITWSYWCTRTFFRIYARNMAEYLSATLLTHCCVHVTLGLNVCHMLITWPSHAVNFWSHVLQNRTNPRVIYCHHTDVLLIWIVCIVSRCVYPLRKFSWQARIILDSSWCFLSSSYYFIKQFKL